jgi:transposase-like protein
MMLTSKKGMSALQIHRIMFGEDSGSDYRTSWYICTRLRAAMKGDVLPPFTGVVEVDETGIGGKDKNRHWDKKQHIRGMSGKTTVIGAISRKGNVVCKVIENTDAATLSKFVRQTVSGSVELVATDEHLGYDRLKAEGLPHETVTHSAGEYVRGNVHTNSIESFWALLKRGIVGTFHNVSKDYLPLYLNEFSFRHNHRKDPNMFEALLQNV